MDKFVEKFWVFKNWYFFVVLIFSGLSTEFVRGYGGTLVLFFLSLLYAIIYKINYINKKFFVANIIWLFFAFITAFRNNEFLPLFTFEHITILFISFTLIYLYGKELFYLYEKSVFYLACISLVGWSILMLVPDIVWPFAYTYNMSEYMKEVYDGAGFILFNIGPSLEWGFYRNFGFCFEPGPWGQNLVLAMFFNIFRNKGNFNNKIFYVLFIALLTTLSTTAYLAFAIGFLIFIYQRDRRVNRYFFVFLFISIFAIAFFNLDFLGDKVFGQQERATVERIDELISLSKETGNLYSAARFGGFIVAYKDFIRYPLFGTGGHKFKAYGGGHVYIVNGWAQTISWYGLFGIIILVMSLYKMSLLVASVYGNNLSFVFCGVMCFSIVGFGILNQYFMFPLILMGWFYPSKKYIN